MNEKKIKTLLNDIDNMHLFFQIFRLICLKYLHKNILIL
jgi:hypothetical protein